MNVTPVKPPVSPNPPVPAAAGIWAGWRKRLAWMQEGEGLKEAQLFLFLAMIIGLFSGLSVVLFRVAIDWTKLLAFGSGLTAPWTRLLVIPMVGGLVVGFMVMRFFPGLAAAA